MKGLGTKKLETKRLILRRIEEKDYIKSYLNWTSDPLVTKYVTWNTHENEEVTREYFQSKVNKYRNDYYFDWLVVVKDSGEIIGEIEARAAKDHNLVEIGYCYGSRFWGKGYGTEALKAVINYMFKEVEVRKILARHISTNPASGKVMEKAGMKLDGILKGYVVDKNTNSPEDFHMYSIDYEDWKNI